MRIPLQFDIGFGDIITPEVRVQEWPAHLDYESISLVTYPMETVIAEKLEAAVSLGINNSRMKDFYDLHCLQALKGRHKRCLALSGLGMFLAIDPRA